MADPLAGVRVLDLTQVLAGPYASMVLGTLGADVIKVERPPEGDPARRMTPLTGGVSAYFMAANINKRSIVLDLQRSDGQALFLKMARHADVVLDNFRPGVMTRLGLDYPRLAEVNPAVIACSISAFGQDGPYRDRPAFDLVIQAMSGLMSVTGEPGRPPVRMGLPMGDIGGGLAAVIGIQAALVERARTGRGQAVDVALLDALIGMQSYIAANRLATGIDPEPVGSAHPNIVPYQSFRCRDGDLAVATFTDPFWQRLAPALGLAQLAEDPRYATNVERVRHRATLIPTLEAVFRTRSRAEWYEILRAAGVPAGPVNSVGEALDDPQVRHRGMILTQDHPTAGRVQTAAGPVRFGPPRDAPHRPAPLLGQHTREILREVAGCDVEEVERLLEEGVAFANEVME